MSDVLLKHLDALAASVALMQGQIAAMRHAVAPPPVPKITVPEPDRLEQCDGVPEAHCARMNEDARISKASFGNPHAGECKGCGSKVDLTLTM
jgi:hypothetical protein